MSNSDHFKNFTATPDIYVAHISGSIICIGSKEQCESYKAERPFATDCWKITDIESFGADRYDDGHECGYDSGYESAQYLSS